MIGLLAESPNAQFVFAFALGCKGNSFIYGLYHQDGHWRSSTEELPTTEGNLGRPAKRLIANGEIFCF
jgi:hypothetical protein